MRAGLLSAAIEDELGPGSCRRTLFSALFAGDDLRRPLDGPKFFSADETLE